VVAAPVLVTLNDKNLAIVFVFVIVIVFVC
jgi:hypothetical protein